MGVKSGHSRRLSRRDRTHERQRREKKEQLKEFAHAAARGIGWTVLFFGLMVSLAAALVAFMRGEPVYAVLYLLLGVLVGVVLMKWESSL